MKMNELIDVNNVPKPLRRSLSTCRKAYDSMYQVDDVVRGFRYYQKMLLEKSIAIYEYSGLPDTIPPHEIERLLMTLGACVFVNSDKYGLVVLPCTFSGVGVYPDLPPDVIWATPLVSGQARREDVAVGYNNSTHIGLADTIDRYSRLLADVDATFAITLYNQRIPSIPLAPDDNSAESYNAAMLANRLGITSAVVTDALLKDVQMLPIVPTSNGATFSDIIDARENVLKIFLSELGVQYGDPKRERQTTDEIHMNTQALIVNSADMLAAREKMCADVNARYGTNISVRINPAYDVAQYGEDVPRGTYAESEETNGNNDREND